MDNQKDTAPQSGTVPQSIPDATGGTVDSIQALAVPAIGNPFSAERRSWLAFDLPSFALVMVLTTGLTITYMSRSLFMRTPSPAPVPQMHGAAPEPGQNFAMTLLPRRQGAQRDCTYDPKTKACVTSSTSSSVAPHAAANDESSSSSSSSSDESSSSSSSEVSSESMASSSMWTEPIKSPSNKIGVYLTSASVGRDKFFKETIDKLVAAGGTALIFDVKGSRVYFNSTAPYATELGMVISTYDLPEVIRYAKERNLYVMGRFVSIKDDGLTTRLPETKIRHPKTGQVLTQTWVDPANEKVLRYNAEVMCDLAAMGIDEVNMDYIRFSTAEFGALMAYSADEKAERVLTFIKAMREAIDRCGPNTKLGISSYAILGWDYEANVKTLGQDVKRFAPYLDIISPMAYPATFTSDGYWNPAKHGNSRMYWLVKRTLTGYQELLGPEHAYKLRPWIQGYYVDTKDVTDQMRAVYDAGLCGFTVWNANNNYGPTFNAMKQYQRPVECIDEPTL